VNWLRRLRDWWRELIEACGEPWPDWNDEFPDSYPPIPDDFSPSTTQPIRDPGALDTLPGKLE